MARLRGIRAQNPGRCHMNRGHFMTQLARHYDLKPRPLSPSLLDACQRYSWPGNLRELENVMKRYLVMGDESLETGKLGAHLADYGGELAHPSSPAQEANPGNGSGDHPDSSSLKSLVRTIKGEAERSAIASTLEKTHWNRKEAARQLRISYRGLLYKIREYQLVPPSSYVPTALNNAGWRRNRHEQ